jgi:hypothetical protein
MTMWLVFGGVAIVLGILLVTRDGTPVDVEP